MTDPLFNPDNFRHRAEGNRDPFVSSAFFVNKFLPIKIETRERHNPDGIELVNRLVCDLTPLAQSMT